MRNYAEICTPGEVPGFAEQLMFIATFFWYDEPIVSLQRQGPNGDYLIHLVYDRIELGGTFKHGEHVIPVYAYYELYSTITVENLKKLAAKQFTFKDVLLQAEFVFMTEHINSSTETAAYLIKDVNLLGDTLPSDDSYFDEGYTHWKDFDQYVADDKNVIMDIFNPLRPFKPPENTTDSYKSNHG